MSTFVTILFATIVWTAVDFACTRIKNRWGRRHAELERESLDLTIKGAYIRGFLDAHRHYTAETGADTYVMEWREQWGTERREVRK